MKYLGGKHKIAKPLCSYLESRREGRYFVEPFCGGLSISVGMASAGERLASDASPYLFSLYSALRDGWDPPSTLSEEEYADLKRKKDPENPMTAFAGYGCSFAAKFFAGYARGSSANYALSCRTSLLKKLAASQETTFARCSYDRLSPDTDCLVYCDPPYAGTTGYSAVGAFDSGAFWQRVRDWTSAGSVVLVSEYSAPADFNCVWEHATRTGLGALEGKCKSTVERLYEWSGA